MNYNKRQRRFSRYAIINAIILMFWFICLSNATTLSSTQGGTDLSYKYEEVNTIEINKKVQYEDGLTILLTSFSHKRPRIGGRTKATAHMSLSIGELTHGMGLSLRGVQGKSEAEDGLSDSVRYDHQVWEQYEFQLTGFTYNKSIKVIITKKK